MKEFLKDMLENIRNSMDYYSDKICINTRIQIYDFLGVILLYVDRVFICVPFSGVSRIYKTRGKNSQRALICHKYPVRKTIYIFFLP